MAWRFHGRAEVNPNSPRAFGVCDRCGALYNLENLKWQYQFAGVGLVNLGLLVCNECLDVPQPQLTATILPPDPTAVMNARPEFYVTEETSPVVDVAAQIIAPGASLSPFYIDLFDGDPAFQGSSVLAYLTGSPLRTNYADSMSGVGTAVNTSDILISVASQETVNVIFIGIYDEETGGNLLMSAPLINPSTIVLYNGLQFPAGSLQVRLT